MGHSISRSRSPTKAVAPMNKANEVASPIMTKNDTQMDAAAHEKLRRLDSEQCLTEEMIEGLTRSSTGSVQSKAKKKDAINDWIATTNYVVEPNMDALKQHEDSMRALNAMQTAKHELRCLSNPDLCSSSKSKGSKRKGALDILKSRS
ncbi:hypothetical protein LSCM1_05175 [Leishmania martiniquensis]|uniref:Uncharacterized protein n=1 Tax=Leishmania martiniquensis TaxID=1580590 RepID=A0A836HAG0_9TRYP|nr:hypothetical protein LSCM1_05175 [Leishmania martiniquensis]